MTETTLASVPIIKLNDGQVIPQLGFGTYQVKPDDTIETVSMAINAGYRHIDTAEMYRNEKQVGEAIKKSGIDRAEFFITSKLNNNFHEPKAARQAFADTLEALGTDYIDLFLIHWPLPTLYDGDYVSTWKTMIEFKNDGRAKSVGVSNFQVDHLQKIIDETDTMPAVNQIELHPYFLNNEVDEFGKQHGIATEAWSPIAQGEVLDDQIITAIADEHGKTPAQIVLRWHIQHDNIVFPKSSTESRIKENFEIFDFELSGKQMTAIDKLDKGETGRTGPNPSSFDYRP